MLRPLAYQERADRGAVSADSLAGRMLRRPRGDFGGDVLAAHYGRGRR